MSEPTPRVRIAPSPTGDPHIGTAYIALFNHVFTKKHGGKFILRIEDTDRARYRKSSEDKIMEALKWFGVEWDEGPDIGGPHAPYRQSERLELYQKHAKLLVEQKKAYPCTCTVERLEKLRAGQMAAKLPPGYDKHCRNLSLGSLDELKQKGISHTIRLAIPLEGGTSFKDGLRGAIEFEHRTLDDLVLLKADGFPTYHLANVVDDHAMEITHVIRGEEWVSSTPKHVLLYQAFGWTPPEFYHLNLLRNPDKSKISKRRNPTSILYYQRKGILPATLRNFLALMGWSFGGDQEKFTTAEMIENFSWDRFSLGGPVFDLQKLLWLNGLYMRELSDDQILECLRAGILSDQYLKKVLPLIKDRMEAFESFIPLSHFFFSGDLDYSLSDIIPKGRSPKDVATWLSDLLESFESTDEWGVDFIRSTIETYLKANDLKTKEYYMAIRNAVAGTSVSPPLFEMIEVLGQEMTRRRLRLAIQYCKAYKPATP